MFVARFSQHFCELIGSFFFAVRFRGGPGDIEQRQRNAIRDLLLHAEAFDGCGDISIRLSLKHRRPHKKVFHANTVGDPLSLRRKSLGQHIGIVRRNFCVGMNARWRLNGRSLDG
ncbi:MAG: hypothetical protein NTAFB01_01690 [Nitrospira sp.]